MFSPSVTQTADFELLSASLSAEFIKSAAAVAAVNAVNNALILFISPS
jgi:uncharacterized protein (DUF4213/DUF364 family)